MTQQEIYARTQVKLLTNRRKIHLKLFGFSHSKYYRYITKPKLKMRANEAPLQTQTRSRIKTHERSLLEVAVETWNS